MQTPMKGLGLRQVTPLLMLVCASLGIAPSASATTEPFLGEIMYVGFTFCPPGWAEASGQLELIVQNSALYSLLGTQYGGDGITTFALPDLRGRAPLNSGQGAGLSQIVQGEKGGSENVSMTFAMMPAHSHTASTTVDNMQVTSTLRASSANATTKSPAGNSLAVAKQPTYASSAPAANMAVGSVQSTVSGTATTTVDATNSGTTPVPVRDPYLGLKACIAIVGVFPPRD